jgi:hypothetical protein
MGTIVVRLTQHTTVHMAGGNNVASFGMLIHRTMSEEWHLLSLRLPVFVQPTVLIILGQTPSFIHGHRFDNFRTFIYLFVYSF